jgi:hypothetical protein
MRAALGKGKVNDQVKPVGFVFASIIDPVTHMV